MSLAWFATTSWGRIDVDIPMDEKTVHRLERELTEAIAGVLARLGSRKLPLLPSQQTMHLMAKAAVSVYESAVENQREPD